MKNRRVLISTIAPVSGGVPTMTGFVVQTLRQQGFEPILAHYEPYSVSPQLSVPSFKLLQHRVGVARRQALDGCETHAIGAWLPELEFTHYYPSAPWQRVMDSCSAFVAVAGNALAATPFCQTDRPFLAWLASDWEGDRKDRVAHFPWPRRLLDSMVNARIIRRLERQVLQAGSVLALSQYTRRTLDSIAGTGTVANVLPMPVDSVFFHPQTAALIPGRIGFSGRFDDPRKNLDLLLRALAKTRGAGVDVTALLIGGEPTDRIRTQARALGIADAVEFVPYLPRHELRERLQTLDVFVLPSHQEGLCIAALEAMACGCPVIATRCGGPEEYVIDGDTGFLVDFDPGAMADAIARLVADRVLRAQLGCGARQIVCDRYQHAKAETVFWTAFGARFQAPGAVDNPVRKTY